MNPGFEKLRRPNRTLSGLTVALVLAGLIGVARAHVIPPEKLHPVAAAYRRASFMLNLTPVLWDEVRKDVETIEAGVARLDAEAAERLDRSYTEALDLVARAEDESSGLDPRDVREQARRKTFEVCTQAIAGIVVLHLEQAKSAAPDRIKAGEALKKAREIFLSFDDTLRYLDGPGHKALGLAFLEAAHAMGSEGLLEYGARPFNVALFRDKLDSVSSYLRANFGASFRAGSDRRLAPRPRLSPTYDATAMIPPRIPPTGNLNKQIPRPRQLLNMASRGVSELDTPLIAIGDMAFDSAYIFGEPARSLSLSCNTCHNKGVTNPNFFLPGLSSRAGGLDVSSSFFAPHANNGLFDPLDIPDLRGIRFTAPYGRNGRFASLREFTRNVIVNEFNGPEPEPLILDAMVAYMNEFDFLTVEHLEPDGTLTRSAPEAAQRGEEIFNRPFAQLDDRSCATCHVPSNHFVDGLRHDVGSVKGFEPGSRDRAMDTPTLLGIKYTPPFMHDGSLPTLAAVVDWFDHEHGLGLSDSERDDLTAYLETVGDGVDAYEDSPYYLDAEMEEFSFFLRAYETLRDRGRWRVAEATFQTIAGEIRNHKWELQDLAFLPVMEQLAVLMDDAYEASLAGDHDAVDEKVATYRKVYAANSENLK